MTRVCLAAVLLSASALATPTIEIEDLGGGVFDVRVPDLNGGSEWTGAGLFGETFGGATFRASRGPNDIINPTNAFGATDVTFVSTPAPRSSSGRFNDAHSNVVWGERYSYLWDGYRRFHPTLFDFVYYAHPWDPPPPPTGYIARVAIDPTGTGFSADELFATAGPAPDGSTILATGITGAFSDAHPLNTPFGNGVAWTVYAIPEPATVILLTLGGLATLRRR